MFGICLSRFQTINVLQGKAYVDLLAEQIGNENTSVFRPFEVI